MGVETILLAALDANELIEPITARDPGFDADAAYRVSAEILKRRRARGETPVGRKIGFTNRTIWPEYGMSEPLWAHVYDTTVTRLREPSGTLAIGHLAQPRLEPEIVLHFKSAPPATEDEAELLSHVDWVAHGYEIVQCHFAEWKFRPADAIADFGLHGALVVGPPRDVADLDDVVARLREFTITLATGGTVHARGGGASVLGSPLLAVAHLLRVLTRQPAFDPIQAGEIVTTGTLVPPPSAQPGATWRTEVSGIDLPGLELTLER